MKLICSEDTEVESQYDNDSKVTTGQLTASNLEKHTVWLHNKVQILDTVSTNYSSIVSPESFRRKAETCRVRIWLYGDVRIWKTDFWLVFMHHVIRQIRLQLRQIQQREAQTANELEKVRTDSSALKPNLFTGRTTEITAIYRHWVYLAHSVATTSIHLQGISQLSRKRLEDYPWGHYFWILCALNSNLL